MADDSLEDDRFEPEKDAPTEGNNFNGIQNPQIAERMVEEGMRCQECGNKGGLQGRDFEEHDNKMGNSRWWSGDWMNFHVRCVQCGQKGQVSTSPLRRHEYEDATAKKYILNSRCRVELIGGMVSDFSS